MAERSKRVRTGPLTAKAVVDAALAVIDGEGLEALTMRRLAHDLGVEPVTIYRQLPNKEAILAGVAEKLWRESSPEIAAPASASGDDWRAQIRAMWLSLNELMQRHPNAIPIIARGGSFSATAAEGTAEMLRTFRDAGLSPGEAAELLHILSACVVGFGFATVWGREIAAATRAAAAAGGPAPAPPDAGDLGEYVAATAQWDPAQFAAAVDIVLGAYGDQRR